MLATLKVIFHFCANKIQVGMNHISKLFPLELQLLCQLRSPFGITLIGTKSKYAAAKHDLYISTDEVPASVAASNCSAYLRT
jgi:hypothetical protein